MTQQRKKILIVLVMSALCAGLMLLVINPATLWLMWSPRYSDSALRGQTAEQVIDRLGKPSDEADTGGKQVLRYYRGLATCRIELHDGVVVEVQRYVH